MALIQGRAATWTGRHRGREGGGADSLSLCPGQLNSEQRHVRLALYSISVYSAVLREIYLEAFSLCGYGTKPPLVNKNLPLINLHDTGPQVTLWFRRLER